MKLKKRRLRKNKVAPLTSKQTKGTSLFKMTSKREIS
jgi:hypothetical protein